MGFPSGIPMHLSANQPQQQLATCGLLNLRCGHEGHSQSSSRAKQSSQIAVFRGGLRSLASVNGDLGEVRCIHSNFPRRSLELRRVMKQLKLGQFSLGRLRSYLLASERARSGAIQGNSIKNRFRSDTAVGSGTLWSTSSARTPEEIRKTIERRWPARYY
jgi:hypothetical protein